MTIKSRCFLVFSSFESGLGRKEFNVRFKNLRKAGHFIAALTPVESGRDKGPRAPFIP